MKGFKFLVVLFLFLLILGSSLSTNLKAFASDPTLLQDALMGYETCTTTTSWRGESDITFSGYLPLEGGNGYQVVPNFQNHHILKGMIENAAYLDAAQVALRLSGTLNSPQYFSIFVDEKLWGHLLFPAGDYTEPNFRVWFVPEEKLEDFAGVRDLEIFNYTSDLSNMNWQISIMVINCKSYTSFLPIMPQQIH